MALSCCPPNPASFLPEAPSQVIARSAVEPYPLANFPSDYPEAIPLDFMQPDWPGRRLLGFDWQARRNEARRQDTGTQRHNVQRQ
jgi:hypothetical protein